MPMKKTFSRLYFSSGSPTPIRAGYSGCSPPLNGG